MSDVWHRHVVGTVEEFVPIEISIENAGTIAGRSEFSAVVINPSDTAKEFFAVAKEVTVMIEIVDVYFEAALANGMQKFVGDFIANFGDDLKGRFDAERVIEIHERAAEVAAYGGLHVVGHGSAARTPVRPKPDEGDTFARMSAYDTGHHAIEQAIDGLVHGPAGKTSTLPSAESHALQMFAHRCWQEGAHGVIGLAADGLGHRSPNNGHGPGITLKAQILDKLV
jgi:hypothetical protein